jgi:hypothetical protein
MSTIVDAGESDAVVRWTGRDDTPVARFAAREFRDYAEALSGAALPVSEGALPACDRAASAVTIAAPDAPVGEALSAADDALDGRGDDAFAARTAEDAVALAGTTPRGTLYAVYALLERFGVRFFAPSFPFYEGHAEHVPDHPSLTVSDGFAEEPSFDYRRKYAVGVSVTPGTLPTLVDWLAKARHNVLVVDTDYEAAYGLDDREAVEAALVDPLRKRGLTLEAGGHNFHRYLPRAEYAADHPEWFVDDYNVFDLSDDDAVATLTENIAEDLATKPEVDIFDAWPPDAASWPPEVIEAFGSVANAYAHAVERSRPSRTRVTSGRRMPNTCTVTTLSSTSRPTARTGASGCPPSSRPARTPRRGTTTGSGRGARRSTARSGSTSTTGATRGTRSRSSSPN